MSDRAETDILNMLNLNIEWASYRVLDSAWKCTSLAVPFSRLYFVRRGEGWIRHGSQTSLLRGGHVYLVPAHLEISYGCIALEKIYFHVSLLGFEKTDILSALHNVHELPFTEADFSELLKLLRSTDYLDLLKIKQFLFQTVISFLEQYCNSDLPVREYSENVKKTMLYIQKNLSVSLTSSKISKELFLSETKMRTDFKKETGKTIGEYKNDLIFSQVSILLTASKLSVAEISRKYGFCDPYHLSRRFKERFHQTPTEYRRANDIQK